MDVHITCMYANLAGESLDAGAASTYEKPETTNGTRVLSLHCCVLG
jgi:hypothetical protein